MELEVQGKESCRGNCVCQIGCFCVIRWVIEIINGWMHFAHLFG